MSQTTGSLETLIAVIVTLNSNIEKLLASSSVALNAAANDTSATEPAEEKKEVKKEEKKVAEKSEKVKETKAEAKAEKTEKKETKKTESKSKVSKSDMVEALRKVRIDVDKDAAIKIIQEVGEVEKMAQIPEDKYEDVFNACEAALNGEVPDSDEGEEEDM